MKKLKRSTLIILIIVIAAAGTAIALAFAGYLPGFYPGRRFDNGETVFYIIRHAETEANAEDILSGSGGDYPLTSRGKKQAIALGEGLRGIRFDSCYTSEMGRARTTAEIVLDQSDNPETKVYQEAGLDDLNWGSLEGRSIASLSSQWPDFSIEAVVGDGTDPDFTPSIGDGTDRNSISVNNDGTGRNSISVSGDGTDRNSISVSGVETRYACTERITETMNRLASDRKNIGRRILISAHSSISWFIENAIKDDPRDYSEIDNASLTVLVYKDGKWEIKDYNDTNYSTMRERLKGHY